MDYTQIILAAIITGSLAALFFYFTLKEIKRYKDQSRLNINSKLNSLELEEILTRKVKSVKNDQFTLMMIDIDDYQQVKSELLPEEERFVLELIDNTIKKYLIDEVVVSSTELVDKFILYLPKGYDYSRVLKVADNIKKALSRKIDVYGKSPVMFKLSIAIVNYPNHSNTVASLFEALNLNMFEIKKAGGNQIKYYSVDVNENYETFQLSLELKNAIKNNEFIFYYQPLVEVNGQNPVVTGFESLIRWEHPTRGLLTPYKFIDLLESTGELEGIGLTGLESGVMLVRRLSDLTNKNFTVNINLSARQILVDKNIVFFQRLVNKHRVKSQQVIIELPNFAEYASNENLLRNVVKLITAGFRIAIDIKNVDYNLLNDIPNYPINLIKISSKLLDQNESGSFENFMNNLTKLAKQQKIDLLAESVETDEDEAIFRKYDIRLMQGYKYYEPMSEKALTELLNQKSEEIIIDKTDNTF